MIRVWLPNTIWFGKMKNAAMAASHGSASAGRRRLRRTSKRAPRARSAAISPPADDGGDLFASIKSRRLEQQDQHRNGIDGEGAGVGEKIFAGGIRHPEHQRAAERAPYAAGAADRDDQ